LLSEPTLKDKVGVAELPRSAGGPKTGIGTLGGQDLVIPKNSLHKSEAREFIRFLTQPDQQRLLFSCGGYVPTIAVAYKNVKSCSDLTGDRQQESAEGGDPVSETELRELAGILQKALEHARLRPTVPYYPGFSRAFHSYLHDAITKRMVVDGSGLAARLTACAGWTPPGESCF
jgi:ABC-type glycerol-3-phosphate transport system substrate-binding protein